MAPRACLSLIHGVATLALSIAACSVESSTREEVVVSEPKTLSPPEQETHALRERCEAGDAVSCRDFAERVMASDGHVRDLELAHAMFRRACSGGVADACMTGARALQPEAPERAFDILTVGCERGYADICNDLGVALEKGSGAQADPVAALKRFAEACAGDNGLGCLNEGRMHERGLGTPVDVARAVALYQTGCAMKDGQACLASGLAYANGQAPEPEPGALLQAFKRACEYNEGKGCTNVGVLLRSNDGDAVEVAAMFKAGCTLTDPRGCEELAPTCRPTVGCATPKARPAAENEPSSAVTKNARARFQSKATERQSMQKRIPRLRPSRILRTLSHG